MRVKNLRKAGLCWFKVSHVSTVRCWVGQGYLKAHIGGYRDGSLASLVVDAGWLVAGSSAGVINLASPAWKSQSSHSST